MSSPTASARCLRTIPLRAGVRRPIRRAFHLPTSRATASAPKAWTPTPYVTETVGGGWHTYDIFSRLLKERIVCLNDTVDETVSASIVAQLLFLEADNPEKPIHLYINSPGGSVTAGKNDKPHSYLPSSPSIPTDTHYTAGLAIYDTMTYISSPVTTIALGQAASMGSLLLAGGHPGRRYCLPHSSIMIHQPSGGYHGQASDIAIHAREILRVRKQLNGIYERHLTKKMTLEEIEALMERDHFMGAAEALELGIVDRVLTRRAEVGEEEQREGQREGKEGGGKDA
ncbi:MAG: hypothetical protein M1817_002749 [Caeruleum heppii]|nr:MAG: hypothetical protein M1817_002749 [Caeruleum heppii]